MVNLYNANIEKDQLNTINELKEMSKSVNNISAKQMILGGDFNLYFDSWIESQGGLKKPIAKMIELKSTFKTLRYLNETFFFVSNVLQESIYKTVVLASFCSDHSPILFA